MQLFENKGDTCLSVCIPGFIISLTFLRFDGCMQTEGMGATDDQNLQTFAHRGKPMPMNSAIILIRVTFLRKIDHILLFHERPVPD